MKAANISRIDYLVVTHYHTDHVGGVAALAAKVPVGTFIDHGATVEDSADPGYTAYLEARKRGKNLQAKPGDTIPIAGLQVTVVSSAGETIKSALPGAGAANPLCAAHKPQPADGSENARSVGMVIGYGAFRMLDLGDLTWNVEYGLACPSNLIGPIDLYLTTHHGNQQSGPPALLHAIKPRVAVMNNGADKGGSPAAWHIVRDSPGLQDFWQLHTAKAGGRDANTADDFIANLDETTSHMIKISAREDGSFTVTNSRNGVTRTYTPAGAR
jgi:competence protein ComEC